MAGNNWPLRGQKLTAWEGGTRVVAFVSGGFVPEDLREAHHGRRRRLRFSGALTPAGPREPRGAARPSGAPRLGLRLYL